MKKVLSIAALLLLCFTVTTQAQISKEDREARREALRRNVPNVRPSKPSKTPWHTSKP